tara:strand:- start:1043 stop:1507 length:465 start_codon:yes stop_codon:yes gene_type:complete
MIKINTICNNKDWYKYIKNPDNYIQSKINNLNKKFKKYKKKKIFCSLLLSGNREIKKLNKKFRKKNKTTDILSFPFHNKKEFKKKLKKENEIYLGDIIINIDKIKVSKGKKDFRILFNKLWVHGLTHLFGHDHKKDKDFQIMSNVEKKFLSYLK